MRPPTMDDLEVVYQLCLAQSLALIGEEEMSRGDLRTYWTAPSHDLGRDERLVFDRDGQLLASLYTEQSKYARFFMDVAVRPGYNDPRVGDYLVELAESWVWEQMVQADPDVRVYMTAQVSAKNPHALARCARQGFREVRRYWEMTIDLHDSLPTPAWPDGVELRPFRPDRDAHAVFRMMDTSFEDHWGHLPGTFEEWRQHRIGRPDFDASLWFIAYDGDEIVGGALCTSDKQGWVNTLGVLRPWRHKGLGLALLYHAFGEFYRRGQREAMLGVDSQNLTGAVRLYQRAGMHMKFENIRFEKVLREGVELSTQVLSV